MGIRNFADTVRVGYVDAISAGLFRLNSLGGELMNLKLSAVVAVGSAAFIAACGPSADQACTDIANAMCAKNQQCNPDSIQRNWGDIGTCQARQKQQCLDYLSAPGTGNNPSHTESCAQAYPSWDCESWFLNIPPTPCVPPQGKLAAGTACLNPGQCQSSFCNVPTGTQCGTCAALPQAGDSCSCSGTPRPGGSCGNTNCGRGLLCTYDLTCSTPVFDGGTCDTSHACANGYDCVGATTLSAGACTPLAATAGATCDSSSKTAPRCDGTLGLVCLGAATARSCATYTFAPAGQPCGLTDGGFVECGSSSFCSAKTCIAAANDGEACDNALGPSCTPPARCIAGSGDAGTSGTCVFPNAASCQ